MLVLPFAFLNDILVFFFIDNLLCMKRDEMFWKAGIWSILEFQCSNSNFNRCVLYLEHIWKWKCICVSVNTRNVDSKWKFNLPACASPFSYCILTFLWVLKKDGLTYSTRLVDDRLFKVSSIVKWNFLSFQRERP